MASSNVIVGEMAQLGRPGAKSGAFNAMGNRLPKAHKTPVVPAFRRVCCKTCCGKSCLGRCKF
jgi:hypothetical protein